MLFDEPFAALDASARAHARRLFSSMRSSSVARLIVTHDAVEALTLADRIVVVESGLWYRLERRAVLATPRSHFVAEILGLNPYRDNCGDELSLGAMSLTVGLMELMTEMSLRSFGPDRYRFTESSEGA